MKLKAVVSVILISAGVSGAWAKSDPEESHVQVVLFSGDTISGYLRSDLKTGIKNIFSKSGSIRQWINVADEPEGGESKRYSASHVKEYRFLEPTEGYPDGAVTVSESINSPLPFKPNKSVRGFAWEMDRRDNGSILQWNVWESTGGRNSVNRLVPAIGVKLKGARAAYIIIVNGHMRASMLMYYLKKHCPELYTYFNDYYNKGKDTKAHRKELVDNPSTILRLYDEFLETHDPISDPEAEEQLTKESEAEDPEVEE